MLQHDEQHPSGRSLPTASSYQGTLPLPSKAGEFMATKIIECGTDLTSLDISQKEFRRPTASHVHPYRPFGQGKAYEQNRRATEGEWPAEACCFVYACHISLVREFGQRTALALLAFEAPCVPGTC